MVLDPDKLTDTGLEQAGSSPRHTLLIACGALAREILMICDLNGWHHLDLACLPAKLHNRPDQIPQAVRDRIHRARAEGYTKIFIVYADCGTGGLLDTLCAEEGVERIEGPHCYSFFEGNQAFADRDDQDMTAFYLTDFLARQFETLIWKGMGLDRHPELMPMIFGNYTTIVYLAQTDDPSLEAKARSAAEKLGLAFEKRRTGFGDLSQFVADAARA